LKYFPSEKSTFFVTRRVLAPTLLEVNFSTQGLQMGSSSFFGLRSEKNGLWKSLCFEVFFRPQKGPTYYECNVSGLGDWALYQFSSYRQPQPPQSTSLFRLEGFRRTVKSLSFSLRGPFEQHGDWEFGYSMVCPDSANGLQYLATHHATQKPDFHHAQSFVDRIHF
jgi:hypothetical protein